MKEWPAMQVFTKIYITLLSMFYVLKVKPHDDGFTNKMEVVNESCILLFNYHLLLLLNSPGGPPELPFQLGWSFISVFVVFLMSNISIQISNSISQMCSKLRKKRENKKLKKQVPKYAVMIKNRMKVSNKLRQFYLRQKIQSQTKESQLERKSPSKRLSPQKISYVFKSEKDLVDVEERMRNTGLEVIVEDE